MDVDVGQDFQLISWDMTFWEMTIVILNQVYSSSLCNDWNLLHPGVIMFFISFGNKSLVSCKVLIVHKGYLLLQVV